MGELDLTHFYPEQSDDRWYQAALTVQGKIGNFDVTYAGAHLKRDVDIDQERVVIRFGGTEVYPTRLDDTDLAALSDYMRGDEVTIAVSLGTGDAAATVWGCDLTDGYVRINADYTT